MDEITNTHVLPLKTNNEEAMYSQRRIMKHEGKNIWVCFTLKNDLKKVMITIVYLQLHNDDT